MYGRQMEKLIDGKPAGRYTFTMNEDVAKRQRHDEAVINAVSWNAFLAFDIIGDLVG